MITYHKLAKNRERFFRYTGMSLAKFNEISVKISLEYPNFEEKRLSNYARKNAIGQGNKFKHNIRNRIIMLLLYYRLYVTMDLMDFLFNLDKSNISRNISITETLLKLFIPIPRKIYSGKKKIDSLEKLETIFPELIVIVDATEQQINRPQHKTRRDNHYSGKKKIYSKKTQVIVNKDGLILHRTKSTNGKKHDKKLFDEESPFIPEDVVILGDSGYQGIGESVKNTVCLPRKKFKGRVRTKADRRFNRKLSSERILVENVIGKVKHFGIIGKKYRNKFVDYDLKMDIVTGLVNLRTMERNELEEVSHEEPVFELGC